jgi:anti-sigma regulatory factor (Ser/Thr protein kinase)
MPLNPHRFSRLNLACEPSAVRIARLHAKDMMARWEVPQGLGADTLTIVSELVTNAVRHAGAPAEPYLGGGGIPLVNRFALTLWWTGGELNVSVWDESGTPPAVRPYSEDSESGRGLRIIDGLTGGCWGYVRTVGTGKLVWARLVAAGLTVADAGRSTASRRPGRRTGPCETGS